LTTPHLARQPASGTRLYRITGEHFGIVEPAFTTTTGVKTARQVTVTTSDAYFDIPVVAPSGNSRTGPGMPMQVVVPSVSLAEVEHGTARTVRVETPSPATLSKPVSVAGNNGVPTSGGWTAPTGGGAVFEVCAIALDAKRTKAPVATEM
jgi:hypothetical protein